MICQKCNTINADGVRFCGNCGAPMGPAVSYHQHAQSPFRQQSQTRQDGMPYGQPQAIPLRDGHPVFRYHRTFALLRLLWLPLMIVSLVFGEAFYVGWKILGVVWSVVSLLIAIRAAKLRYPKTTFSIVLSLLGIISAIIMNILLVFFEYAAANF